GAGGRPRLPLLTPEERERQLVAARPVQALLVDARASFARGKVDVAFEFYSKAARLQPDSVEIQVNLELCRKHRRRNKREEARQRELARQQALVLEFQRRQAELARAAEEARLRAEQEAAARAAAEQAAQQQLREQAHAQLLAQAQVAFQQNNFQVTIQVCQSAVALKQSDDAFRL